MKSSLPHSSPKKRWVNVPRLPCGQHAVACLELTETKEHCCASFVHHELNLSHYTAVSSPILQQSLFSFRKEKGHIFFNKSNMEKLASNWVLENCRFAARKPKGTLVVFEGADGSGKSCCRDMLVDWLKKHEFPVTQTKWNSSDLVKDAIDAGKDRRELSPLMFCLLHAADMVWRMENVVLPALERNHVVVADRYVYTSYVRDGLRGVDKKILDLVYDGFREPDILFHCSCPTEIAFARLLEDKGFTFYGSGMDLGLSSNRNESCMLYEKKMAKEYGDLLPKQKNYIKLDTNRPKKETLATIKDEMNNRFGIDD